MLASCVPWWMLCLRARQAAQARLRLSREVMTRRPCLAAATRQPHRAGTAPGARSWWAPRRQSSAEGSGFGGQLFWVWIFPSLCFGWWCDWWQSPSRGGNRTPCPGLCEDLAGGLPGLPGQGSQALSDQDEDETSLQLLSADRGVRGVQGLAPATEGYAGAGPKNACRPVCETFDGQAHSSAAR